MFFTVFFSIFYEKEQQHPLFSLFVVFFISKLKEILERKTGASESSDQSRRDTDYNYNLAKNGSLKKESVETSDCCCCWRLRLHVYLKCQPFLGAGFDGEGTRTITQSCPRVNSFIALYWIHMRISNKLCMETVRVAYYMYFEQRSSMYLCTFSFFAFWKAQNNIGIFAILEN